MSLTQRIIKTTALALSLAGSINADVTHFIEGLGIITLTKDILLIEGPATFDDYLSQKKGSTILGLGGVPNCSFQCLGDGLITLQSLSKSTTVIIDYSAFGKYKIITITLPSGLKAMINSDTITTVNILEELALAQKITPVTLEP